MHSLLKRQLRTCGLSDGSTDYEHLLRLIGMTYTEYDRARHAQDSTLQLLSHEFTEHHALVGRNNGEQASQTQKRFELALEGINDGIWDWDVESNAFWFSNRCRAMLGFRSQPLEEDGIEQWHRLVCQPDADKAVQFIADCLVGIKPSPLTLRFMHASGSIRYFMCRASILQDEEGKVERVIGAHTDVTDLVAMQDELKLACERAEAASKAKSDFLANMSHEIRTPMNAIMGMTNLLLETGLDQQQRLWGDIVKNSSELLLDIINDILDISKIEAERLVLEQIPFDLFDAVEHATDTLIFKAREKNLELLTSYSLNTPRFVLGDPVRLRQILINLIGNAIKFTQEGYIAVAVDVRAISDDMVHLYFEVEDTGIGIPEDKLGYIFEKFSQAEESTTRRFGGTGLGLAICRKLVGMMGGDIEVRSKMGEGSTFSFDLHLPVDKSASMRQLELPAELAALRVLVVDDNRRSLETLRTYFRAWQMHAQCFPDAQRALRCATHAAHSGAPFHLAMIDYHLHGMNGKTLAAELRALPGDIQLAALKSGDLGNIAELQEEGFDAVVLKPFTPSRLMNKLALLWEARCKGSHMDLITRYNMDRSSLEKQAQRALDFSSLKILIVEDLEANQIYMQALLGKYGCRADIANHGLEALEQVRQQDYDLIFMDCQMPEMDGLEATRAIRDLPLGRQPFIIALTADAMQGDRERCLKAGMDEYLNKPVKAERIAKVLEDYVKECQTPMRRTAAG